MRAVHSAELEKHEKESLKAIANIPCVSDVDCCKCPLGILINGVVECMRNLSELCLIENHIDPHDEKGANNG
jgi:hypothetical protein